ncbi:hypothetical protein FSP39_010883 [Pinctada imbricata]|uniref:Uncharacterized protein n=1 Tax=Pinctada imbricata TaxID=66713 RepID=A0AA89BYH0_PINIB|nr:hypothetical protein FSP39_010883 [Pinctada imbricata]
MIIRYVPHQCKIQLQIIVRSEVTTMDVAAQLYNAVANDDINTLRDLLQNGADPDEMYQDMQNISSMNILHICANKGRLECAKLLVDAGATIKIRDQWGMTPVAYSVISNYPDVTDFLLSRCPDAGNTWDKFGKAPIHSALEYDRLECLEILLKHSAEVNIATMQGITPLMCLCATTDITHKKVMMSMLLDAGATIDCKDLGTKRTALQYAAIKKNVEDVETLISMGADVNTTDASGRTPLTNVMIENIRKSSDKSKIDDDVMAIIILLIQAGADLNMRICEHSNPLMVATLVGSESLMRLFLDFGASTDVNLATGITPLLAAVSQKNLSLAKLLVSSNCRLDVSGYVKVRRREEHEFDPFELAVHLELWDFVEIFVAFGYNLSKHTYLADSCHDQDVPARLKDNPEMLNLLRQLASAPLSLSRIAALCVRRCLSYTVNQRVHDLPLPTAIKMDILMSDIL